ncbi:galectin-2 isoform X1 [Catharus ustulatus]|uniref:galectin-2 isoform X1 n=1 Tax=Catharus ustulatus TaxID=91951 RepID=UPI00140C67C5|nr:galectin-2 isoform X1 [Catharus ustulatus]
MKSPDPSGHRDPEVGRAERRAAASAPPAGPHSRSTMSSPRRGKQRRGMRKEEEGSGRRSRRRTQRASEGGAGQSAGKQRPRGNRASRPLPEEPVLLAVDEPPLALCLMRVTQMDSAWLKDSCKSSELSNLPGISAGSREKHTERTA